MCLLQGVGGCICVGVLCPFFCPFCYFGYAEEDSPQEYEPRCLCLDFCFSCCCSILFFPTGIPSLLAVVDNNCCSVVTIDASSQEGKVGLEQCFLCQLCCEQWCCCYVRKSKHDTLCDDSECSCGAALSRLCCCCCIGTQYLCARCDAQSSLNEAVREQERAMREKIEAAMLKELGMTPERLFAEATARKRSRSGASMRQVELQQKEAPLPAATAASSEARAPAMERDGDRSSLVSSHL